MRSLLCLLLAGLFLLISSQSTQAGTEADLKASQQRLEEIQEQIEVGLRDLRSKQSKAGSLADDLERLDDEVRRLAAAARLSSRELKKIDARMIAVQQEREELQSARGETLDKVHQRLTTLYKAGEIGLAKVLLSATTTPYEVAENHFFLTRMVRHDRQLIEEYRTQDRNLEIKLTELQDLRAQQLKISERHNREKTALDKAGAGKRHLLAKIRKDEQLLSNYLDELRVKAARLGELVEKLETDVTQSYTGQMSPFRQQKGRLDWPVEGAVRIGFGTTRNAELGTLLESNGLEIAAAVGTPVKAVWAGKVLYASPFRGYGKLLIIDHGEKYYSLYAHVAQLVKHVGEQVTAGETIAYSGFEGRDFLYFEVRHSGKPLDPLPWLKPR